MKRFKSVILSFLFIAFACTTSGCLYSNVRLPLDNDVDNTEFGTRQGEASSQLMLWGFAWGDSSTHAAAQNGGLTTVTHLDLEQVVILFGLYGKRTTIAYGN